MNKRRLSKQQQKRIAAQQQRALSSAGDMALENCNGRVVSHFGKQLQVEATAGAETGGLLHCHQRGNLPDLVTGDRVCWQATDAESGVILARGERRNVFQRPDSSGRDKAIAANLDCVLVMIAAVPEPFVNLIDRYLVAIENLALPAMLVLNKSDLLTEPLANEIDNMLSVYESLGYPVFRISALSGAGVGALESALAGQTTVLVGQSGVGKSSLVNQLGDTHLSTVGELSRGRDKGTHTTTSARLFHLRQCDLIDSPGIREFRVENLDEQQLFYGFRELRPLTGRCKFRNCAHQGEPGCVIAEALETQAIHPLRWQSFCHMRDSLTLTSR